MSVQAITWALGAEALGPSDKLLLLGLANYADADGRCWPSHSTLARDTGLSERTILRAFKRLEDLHFLSRERRSREDGSRATDVIVLGLKGGGDTVSPRGDRMTPRGDVVSPGVGTWCQGGGDMVSPPTTFEPSTEPSKEPPAVLMARPRRAAPVKALVESDQIEAAWAAFPQMSRRNSSRKKFDPAFVAAATEIGAVAVIKAIVSYADDLKTRGKAEGFAKAAHSWLTEGRWRSWLEAEPADNEAPEYDPWPMRRRRWDDDRYWDRDWGPRPDREGCAAPWLSSAEVIPFRNAS